MNNVAAACPGGGASVGSRNVPDPYSRDKLAAYALARFDALLRGAAPTTEDAKRLNELLADIGLRSEPSGSTQHLA